MSTAGYDLGARRVPARGSSRRPSLRVERTLHRQGVTLVAGMDEVGRGALAGPVSVGVVVVDASTPSAPAGVRDSKLLTQAAREALVPRLRRWEPRHGVGHASPGEIDALGIMAALRLAGRRALAATGVTPDLVLLDGNHDWLTDPGSAGLLGLIEGADLVPPVQTLIKADLRCSSVAAASVLAKVERDTLMAGLAGEPGLEVYGWATNKGYAAPEHGDALRAHGSCEHHRRSWNLLGGDLPAGAEELGGPDER